LEEVTQAGYTAVGEGADPIGIAARIAFSQIPRPQQIFIAPQLEAKPSITGAEIKIINTVNAATDGVPIGTIDPAAPTLPWLQVTYGRKALTANSITIEKDNVLVFGKELETDKNKNGFVQVILGDGQNPGEDQMNIPTGEQPGTYAVTLTAEVGARTTTITGNVTLNTDGTWTAGQVSTIVDPAIMSPIETLDGALSQSGWYVACPAGVDESLYEDIAAWTEAQTKLFVYTYLDTEDPTSNIYFRSAGWCGLEYDDQEPEDVFEANRYLHVAVAARCLSFPAGTETWAFKRLSGVRPSQFTSTLIKSITDGDSNYFATHGGRNITMNGKTRGGEWIDLIRGRDWLQNDMQIRVANLFFINPKVPYTNPGIALVQNRMIESLKAAQERGLVAPKEFDDDGVEIPGFVTSVPNAVNLTPTQLASRVLQDVRFNARIAGAIHMTRIDGVLTYETDIA